MEGKWRHITDYRETNTRKKDIAGEREKTKHVGDKQIWLQYDILCKWKIYYDNLDVYRITTVFSYIPGITLVLWPNPADKITFYLTHFALSIQSLKCVTQKIWPKPKKQWHACPVLSMSQGNLQINKT